MRVSASSLMATTSEQLWKEWLSIARQKGWDTSGEVTIRNDGKWCIIEGRVTEPSAKTLLFSLVPYHEGAQWIVDRLKVGLAQTEEQTSIQPLLSAQPAQDLSNLDENQNARR